VARRVRRADFTGVVYVKMLHARLYNHIISINTRLSAEGGTQCPAGDL